VSEENAWMWGVESREPIHPRRKTGDPPSPIPMYAILGATFDMLVTGLHGAMDIVCLLPNEVRIYNVGWEQVFGQVIEDGIRQFWGNLILPRVPPHAGNAKPADLASMYPEAKIGAGMKPGTADARSAAVQLRALRMSTLDAKRQEDSVQAALCAMVGEAEGIDGVCTWKTEKREDGKEERVFRLLEESETPPESLH